MTSPRFLTALLVSTAIILPSLSFAAEPLSPRVEVGVKGGTDRSLLTTEFWAPLAQKSDRVLYGDIRLMGDNNENREGNLGVGYRQIKGNAVLGVHGWIDRRRTQNNSTFHQVTLGVERLGHVVDARANMYVPLNQSRNVTTPNIGQASPYLAGTGIFMDTNGFISETPQYGLDSEIGYRIPVFQKQADAIRVYGGGYHFFRDETQDVTGFRVRTEAQINSAFSVGARFQHDEPRGSQGFLEATIKFPFGAKKLYQTDYLRARLDESPERDVDIVTAAKVDNGLMKPLTNSSGEQQRIIHVDNSNTQFGNGTKENPFNTLKAAEAALRDNDIIYVNHGTGTTAGMDRGIVIDKANVQLIGSGSALTYGGFTLTDAGLAPLITNNDAVTDVTNLYVGNGILVTGTNGLISGVNVANATYVGIRGLADNKNIGNFTVQNVISRENSSSGIVAQAINSGIVENVILLDNQSNNNKAITNASANGFVITASLNGHINHIRMDNNIATANDITGITINANGGSIGDSDLTNLTANGNTSYGIHIRPGNNTTMGNVQMNNIIVTNNTHHGIGIDNTGTATLGNVTLNNVTSTVNRHGILLYSLGTMGNITLNNVTANNNTDNGVYFLAQGIGTIQDSSLTNVTANDNVNRGVTFSVSGTSVIGHTTLNNVTANDNDINGLMAQATGSGQLSLEIANSTFTQNNQSGIFFNNDTTASYSVSLGNGTAGTGGNRIFGNNTTNAAANGDLRLDLNNGTMMAQGNWWGAATGPAGGRIVSEGSCPNSCGTANTTNFLTSDPADQTPQP